MTILNTFNLSRSCTWGSLHPPPCSLVETNSLVLKKACQMRKLFNKKNCNHEIALSLKNLPIEFSKTDKLSGSLYFAIFDFDFSYLSLYKEFDKKYGMSLWLPPLSPWKDEPPKEYTKWLPMTPILNCRILPFYFSIFWSSILPWVIKKVRTSR